MKNKFVAGFLGLFFGWAGAHKFYMNKPIQGILHFIFGPFGWFIAVIEAINYFSMSQEQFDARFNVGTTNRILLKEQFEVQREKLKLERVRLERQRLLEEKELKGYGKTTQKISAKAITGEQADELAAWHDLYQSGIIEEHEYEEKRKIILGMGD